MKPDPVAGATIAKRRPPAAGPRLATEPIQAEADRACPGDAGDPTRQSVRPAREGSDSVVAHIQPAELDTTPRQRGRDRIAQDVAIHRGIDVRYRRQHRGY